MSGEGVDRDLLLGKALIEDGVLTGETLMNCLRLRDQARERGKTTSLSRVLVERGGVPRDDLLRVRREALGEYPCPTCGTTLRARKINPGKPFRCSKCKAILVKSDDRSALLPRMATTRRTRVTPRAAGTLVSARPTSVEEPVEVAATNSAVPPSRADVDVEKVDRRDREYSDYLRQQGLLSDEQIEACLADAARDRSRDVYLPIVRYAVKRGFLSAIQLAETLRAFPTTTRSGDGDNSQHTTLATSPGGDSPPRGTNTPSTLVERLDKRQSPLGRLMGSSFAGHEILDELGRGGMGAVYKARDLSTGQIVALKVLLGGDEASRVLIKRFQREAEVVASLGHRNIVSIHKSGVEDGYHYFTMDYLKGETLKDLVKRRPLSMKKACNIFIRILSALSHAHRKGILHRDLKPSNILMDGFEPVVTDFGLAKRLDSQSQLTKTESTIGTPHYMSPEQIEGGAKDVGPVSDLYAVGVMLYEVVAGRLPFVADSAAQLFHLISTGEPEPPSAHNQRLDPVLDTIVMKSIARDVGDRYGSAIEFSDDLKRFLGGEKIRARPIGPVKRVWRRVRRNPRVAAIVVAAVLVAGVSIALAVRGGPEVVEGGGGATEEEVARQKAEIEYQRGLRLLEGGQAAQSVAAFQAAIALDASFDDASLGLARAHADLDQFEEADRVLGDLLGRRTDHTDAQLLRAEVAYRRGLRLEENGDPAGGHKAYLDARRLYEAVYERDGTNLVACRGLADVHDRLGDRQGMLFYRRQAETLLNARLAGVLDEARAARRSGDTLAALAALEPYLGEEPPNVPVELLHGEIQEAAGNPTRALASYSACVAGEPNDSTYRLARARVLLALGRAEQAVEDLRHVRVPFEAGTAAVYLKGRAAEATGFLAEALRCYDGILAGPYLAEAEGDERRARELDGRLRRGRIRRHFEDFAGAAADLDAALALDPSSTEARFLRAASLVDAGVRLEEAAADLERAAEEGYEPAWQLALYEARRSMAIGQPAAALTALDGVGPAAERIPEVHHERARALLALSSYQAALEAAETAIGLDPFRSAHFKMKGEVLLALDDFEGAEAPLERAFVLDPNDFDVMIGLFRSVFGRVEYGQLMSRKSWFDQNLEAYEQEELDLFEPTPEEIRDRFLAPAAAAASVLDEALLEEYFWACRQADPTVRQAGVQGLVEAGPAVLDRVRTRRGEAAPNEAAALAEVEAGIAAAVRRVERRRVLPTLARTYLGKDPSLLDGWLEDNAGGERVLEAIVTDEQEHVLARRLAARALVDLRTIEGHAAARRLLGSADPFLRAVVAEALVSGGFFVLPSVFEGLLDADREIVRGLAARRVDLSRPVAVAGLDRLLGDDDGRVRLQAASRLVTVEGREAQRAIDVLIGGLEAGVARSRRFAVRSLGVVHDEPRVTAAVIARLADDDLLVRRDSAIRLGRIESDKKDGPAGPALERRLTEEKRVDVQVQVLQALARVGYAGAQEEVQPILFDRKANEMLRAGAFYYFSRHDFFDKKVLFQLPALLQPGEDWVIRHIALLAIGWEQSDNPLVINLILPSLDDEDPKIRTGAAIGCCKFPGDRIRARLVAMLGDESGLVRGAAAGALMYRQVMAVDEPSDIADRIRAGDREMRKGAAGLLGQLAREPGRIPGRTEEEMDVARAGALALAQEFEPDEPDWVVTLIQVLQRLERYVEADRIADEALRRWPDHRPLRLHRAIGALRQADPRRALADLERVVAADRRMAAAWWRLAEARTEIGADAEAATAFHHRWLLDPNDLGLYQPLGRAFFKAGRDAELLVVLDHALGRWPEAAFLHYQRARALARTGDPEGALGALRRARDLGLESFHEARELPAFQSLRGRSDFEALFR